jgi:hypothetical protein
VSLSVSIARRALVQYYRLVLKSYRSFSLTSEAFDWGLCFLGGFMSIGTEILSLPQDRFSSVAALIGALDWLSSSNEHLEMRVYAVTELALRLRQHRD